MRKKLTLGSLFDGIGGFCLAGQLSGIEPIWSSEIEPFPIRVTEIRFPGVLQLGDIHGMNGGDIPPVDIITFGSPCQDLSIAGKRAGIDGNRSSLFFEAVRIITEMRRKTNGQYPRWAVWENVPGALSSHDGYDFRQVLETLIRIKDPEADVPMPTSGKWLGAGEIVGNGCSLAWRILDASKGWGVAQRRRRIFAVLDLAAECAGQVLFESEGLSGYSPPRSETGKTTAGCVEEGTGMPGVPIEFDPADSRIKIEKDGISKTLTARTGMGGNTVPLTLKIRCGCEGGGKGALIQKNLSATLATNNDQTLFEPVAYGICADRSNSMLSDNPYSGIYEAETSRTIDTNGGNPACYQGGMMIVTNAADESSVCAMHTSFYEAEEEKCPSLMARDWKDPPLVCSPKPAGFYPQMKAESVSLTEEKAVCLVNGTNPGWQNGVIDASYTVRRLTPLECCRLQGYPDGWCDGLSDNSPTEEEILKWTDIFNLWDAIQGRNRTRKRQQIISWLQNPNTDAAEYKAYGNSVAVPCVFFVLAGIVWAEKKEEIL